MPSRPGEVDYHSVPLEGRDGSLEDPNASTDLIELALMLFQQLAGVLLEVAQLVAGLGDQ